MQKNLGTLGYLFSRESPRNFDKNRIHFKKFLENFEETQSVLKKYTENFRRDFKYDISIKF